MRRSELANLRWIDIDFDRQTMTIQSSENWQTKNYNYRVLLLTPDLYDLFSEMPKPGNRESKVFDVNCGTLFKVVKSTAHGIGAPFNVSLHTLRRTFASHLVMSCTPLRVVQELLGHSDYKTTLMYVHLSPEFAGQYTHNLPYASCVQNVPKSNEKDTKKMQTGTDKNPDNIVSFYSYKGSR